MQQAFKKGDRVVFVSHTNTPEDHLYPGYGATGVVGVNTGARAMGTLVRWDDVAPNGSSTWWYRKKYLAPINQEDF